MGPYLVTRCYALTPFALAPCTDQVPHYRSRETDTGDTRHTEIVVRARRDALSQLIAAS